ncbi:MAG TPA: hypothetical protein VGD88_11435 [Opitutaceae bacterium]
MNGSTQRGGGVGCCGKRGDDLEAYVRQFDERRLRAMLAVVQLRLGTEDEQPGDMECAGALAHQINNLGTIRMLGDFLKEDDRRQET